MLYREFHDWNDTRSPILVFGIRYWAVNLPDWDYVMFRDLDSVIILREKVAVDEWLSGVCPDCYFHSLRDHPGNYHSIICRWRLAMVMFIYIAHWWHFMAGMWGLHRKGIDRLPFNFTEELRKYLNRKRNDVSTDQFFLQVRSSSSPLIGPHDVGS